MKIEGTVKKDEESEKCIKKNKTITETLADEPVEPEKGESQCKTEEKKITKEEEKDPVEDIKAEAVV